LNSGQIPFFSIKRQQKKDTEIKINKKLSPIKSLGSKLIKYTFNDKIVFFSKRKNVNSQKSFPNHQNVKMKNQSHFIYHKPVVFPIITTNFPRISQQRIWNALIIE